MNDRSRLRSLDRARSVSNAGAIRRSILCETLHPKDVGGAIVSIDRASPAESWGWAGHDWQYHRREDVVNDLVAVEIQADDPERMAERWSLALGKPLSDSQKG